MTETVSPANPSRWQGLGTAALMGIALLLLSFVRQAGDMGSLAFHNGLLDNALSGHVWGTALGYNLLAFVLALIAIHGGFALACWLLARLSGYAFPRVKSSRKQWVVLWAVGVAIWLLIANAARFPHTALGAPYSGLVRAGWGVFNLYHISTVLLLGALTLLAIQCMLRALQARRASRRPSVRLVVVVCAALGVVGAAVAYASHSRDLAPSKPHIIIIGIDSLRYDVATARGPGSVAPNVRKFLDDAVVFSDAITPLARTFPSWVSILTGRGPYTTGAFVNLIPRDLVHTGETLGDLYRRAGYHTVYGIDEVRFSNVDASYGFDQTLTPRIGATDFLLGFFGDAPLMNLIVNSRVGALLFPHVYANRADASLYDPDEFVARIDRNVRFDKPTFLAVHLTLAHWPYTWSRGRAIPESGAEVKGAYLRAVQRVDRQFHDLLSVLEARGALKNALVIVLSDHGEGLGQPDDLLIPQGGLLGEFKAEMQSLGHGTSVISPHQYQVVLSMRTFGAANIALPRGTIIDAPVSLIDLAPTLEDISSLHSRDSFDGQSLLPLLRGEPGAAAAFRSRVRFTESEFNPTGVEVAVKPTTSALESAVQFYRIDPKTDHLEVRPDLVDKVLANRQYAALLGTRMLAAIPRATATDLFDIVLLGRDGSAARKLTSAPGDDDPELAQLWQALMQKLGFSPYTLESDANQSDAKR